MVNLPMVNLRSPDAPAGPAALLAHTGILPKFPSRLRPPSTPGACIANSIANLKEKSELRPAAGNPARLHEAIMGPEDEDDLLLP